MGTVWRGAEEAGELCEMTQVDSCGKEGKGRQAGQKAPDSEQL